MSFQHFKKFLVLVVAVVIHIGTVAADDDESWFDAALEAAVAQDVAQIEAMIAEAESLPLELYDRRINEVFSVFTLSSDKVTSFIDHWLEVAPNSANAQLAKAKQLSQEGWHFRGSGYASATNQFAMDAFYHHQVQASELVLPIVESGSTSPIALSLWLGLIAYNVVPERFDEAVHEALNRQPTRSVFLQALYFSSEKWLEMPLLAVELCSKRLAEIASFEPISVASCDTRAYINSGHVTNHRQRENTEVILEGLKNHDPKLYKEMAFEYEFFFKRRALAEMDVDVFFDTFPTNHEQALKFLNYNNRSLRENEKYDRTLEEVRKTVEFMMEYDPYNPEFIQSALGADWLLFGDYGTDEGKEFHNTLARNYEKFGKYSADYYRLHGSILLFPESKVEDMPVRIVNAEKSIIAANYSYSALNYIFGEAYINFRVSEGDVRITDSISFTSDEVKHMSENPEHAANTKLTNCTLVKVLRLMNTFCSQTGQDRYCRNATDRTEHTVLLSELRYKNVCPAVFEKQVFGSLFDHKL